MGIVVSLISSVVHIAVAGAGAIATSFGPSLLLADGLRVAKDVKEGVETLANPFLSKVHEGEKTPEKILTIICLAPPALAVWVVSLQCQLVYRMSERCRPFLIA